MYGPRFAVVLSALLMAACGARSHKASDYDLIVRHGTIYDGSGGAPRQADVGGWRIDKQMC